MDGTGIIFKILSENFSGYSGFSHLDYKNWFSARLQLIENGARKVASAIQKKRI